MCDVLLFYLDLPLIKNQLFLDPQITKTSYFQKPTKLSRRGYRLSQKPQDNTSENGEKFRNFISNLSKLGVEEFRDSLGYLPYSFTFPSPSLHNLS